MNWKLTFCFASALVLFGQSSGTVEAIVTDASGAAIQGAAVSIIDAATKAQRQGSTDASGRFSAPGLPPSSYDVEVSHKGFRSQRRNVVELSVARSVRVDFQLQIGDTSETVTVEGRPTLISSSAADWGTTVQRAKLESLPVNGRDLYELTTLEDGATVSRTARRDISIGLGTHLSVNGSRPYQLNYRMDGIWVNDSSSGAPTSSSGRQLGIESVEELRLVTSPFSAEYGRSGGAVFTTVSKSGANQFHASLYEFLRNSALDAKNFFDAGNEAIPPLRRNQFGGTVSGPILRNRLFFFANYEALRESTGNTARSIVPNAAIRADAVASVRPFLALYPLPNTTLDYGDGTGEYGSQVKTNSREDYGTGKVDWVPSSLLRFSARYTLDDGQTTAPDAFGAFVSNSVSRHHFVNTQLQWIASANTLHTFRAGFSRVKNGETVAPLVAITDALRFLPGLSLGTITVTGMADFGFLTRNRPRTPVTNDYQFNYDFSHHVGRHTLRGGAGLDRIQFNLISDFNRNGYFRFAGVRDFIRGVPDSAELMPIDSDTVRGWRQVVGYGFIQDEWRIFPRLQLMMGVRYESYSVPNEVNGKIATLRSPLTDKSTQVGGPLFENPSKLNFAPRLSLAWDILGSGKTVLRLGGGQFYEVISTRDISLPGVRTPPFYGRVVLRNPAFPALPAGPASAQISSPDGMEFAPPQPYVVQWHAAIEHQVGQSTVARIGYVGSRGIHLPGQVGNLNTSFPRRTADGRIFFADTIPINPAFDRIGVRLYQFNSVYHALQGSVERRLTAGVRLQAKYAWSKSIDNSSSAHFNDSVNSDNVPQMWDFSQNRGPSDFDIRQVAAVNGIWQARWGLEFHGLLQAQTGNPFSPRVGFDRARLRGGTSDLGQRPDYIGQPGDKQILGDPQKWFDTSLFGLPGAGFYGNLGRNILTGPGLVNVDFAVHKLIWHKERSRAQVRLEAFNVFNHPNFSIPARSELFDSAGRRVVSAGRISTTTTSSRQLQLAFKWQF